MKNINDNELIFKVSPYRCYIEIKYKPFSKKDAVPSPIKQYFIWGLPCFSTHFLWLTLPPLQKEPYNPLFSGFSLPRFHVKGRGPDVTTSPLADLLPRVVAAGSEEVLWKWTQRQNWTQTLHNFVLICSDLSRLIELSRQEGDLRYIPQIIHLKTTKYNAF